MSELSGITPEQIEAYVEGLVTDGDFTTDDARDLINYIIANGDTSGTARDLIQVRRGFKADLPTLAQGEFGLTLDTNEVYIGTTTGNLLVTFGGLERYNFANKVTSTQGLVDFANYAGQGDPLPVNYSKIGFVVHNYTDYICAQLDNVGESGVLKLRQANNASRRPDKPSDYVGQGNMIEMSRTKDDLSGDQRVLNIGRTGDFLMFESKPFTFFNVGQTNGGGYCFRFSPQFTNDDVMVIESELNRRLISFHKRTNRCVIETDSNTLSTTMNINGFLTLDTTSGVVYTNGRMYSKHNDVYVKNSVELIGTTAQRPTGGLYQGLQYYDTTLQKPIWVGSSGWKDANGTSV